MFKLVPITLLLFLSACVSNEIHQSYRDSERISIYKTTCEKPYKLTLGCHPEGQEKNPRRLAAASIPLDINGAKVRYSSTADGKVIYLGLGRALDMGFAMTEGGTFGMYDPKRERLEAAIDGIVEMLKQKHASLIEVVPVTNISEVAGYYIVSDINIRHLFPGDDVTP
ncbi:hypothetical protein [uncultured Pseudoteredinibacter sp.]|uniref:hypothetical protein n=1 Tax=uncultured Pseudoteredinibacter sp. TaxID=1641701 RepID=UPI00260C203D|nr:hypothetical protein [uncultured Pseudoteredinibacter sp.]